MAAVPKGVDLIVCVLFFEAREVGLVATETERLRDSGFLSRG
jgi:hypothetical protein